MPRAVRLPEKEEPTIAELEGGVRFMAWVVVNHGDRYAPILDSLLNHLAIAKRRETPRTMALRILDGYTVDGGLKAIR